MKHVKCFSKGDASNFYHFLVQQLHGLWRYSNELNQILDFYYDGPYVDIIRQIPFLQWHPLSDAPVDCLPIKPLKTHDIKLATEYGDYLKSIFLPKTKISDVKNILIAQRSQNRIIKNDDELMVLLKNLGDVKITTLECLSFIQQVEAICNAKVIISSHGAGLAHMLFAAPDTIFIEVYSKGFSHYYPYRDMAKMYNLNHTHVEAIYSSTEYYSPEDLSYIESFKDDNGRIDGKTLHSPELRRLRVLIRNPRYIKCDIYDVYNIVKTQLECLLP